MAENKKSVILYCDIIHTVEELSDEEAGRLFKHYLRYINDLEPEAPDKITKIAFEPIKHQLKRDLVKWDGKRAMLSESGRLGGIRSGQARSKMKQNEANASKSKQNEANEAVNVNVNDNVNEESNTPAADLKNSNLFRQPVIPTKEDVYRAFLSSGGTKEMADVFYDKNDATNWFLRGSPIINFRNLLPSFISNWTKNEKNGKSTGANQDATEKFNTRLNHANRYG